MTDRIPNSLIVPDIPEPVFDDQELKNELEMHVKNLATPTNVIYLPSFKRVRFDFENSNDALYVRQRLSMFLFHAIFKK